MYIFVRIGNVRVETSEWHNSTYYLLLKSYRGHLILAAIAYDKKFKSKPLKIDKYVHKLAKLVVENEFFHKNYE